MKTKLLLFAVVLTGIWFINTGFSPNDDSPKWSQDPRTRINIDPQGDYIALPQGDNGNFSNETRYISTPQGVFAVGPNFRVHPTATRTQSETPITRHPRNPNFMFASANTYNVGGTTTFSTAHYVTTNGGVSFFGDDTTVFNFGDPAPMIMHTNRLIISYITSTGSMGAAWSSNLGTTWSGTVTFPGATTSADKNLSAVDGEPTSAFYGRIYTVYTEFAGANVNRIVATWSSDGGVTWSNVIPISPVPSAGHHHQGCDVAVDPYGWVRVVYANCTTNGQNSTEDYLGWAESGTGGVSWADMSDTKVNMNGIRTSDLLTPSNVAIRANGFPRIDIDRTCLPSADDAYVVAGEKNFAPALDNADIVLMRTPDGGSSWTRVRVNQNPAGSYEYFPAVNVDATGGINVCYYSTRNIPTNDSAQIYLSRSTDGGTSWVDILVSDHKFKPVPISGLAAGYQGDYIGITSGGAGKIIPYWAEQNPSTGGRYQAYASLVDINISAPCEPFTCAKDSGTTVFPLSSGSFYEEFTGTNYWGRKSQASAYGSGTGSVRFNSWSASTGTSQSLISYQFTAAGATTYLTFDAAYKPWSGGNIDSLIVESSVNGGVSYTVRARLWGGLGAQAGPLNSVFTGGGQFIPSNREWRPKIYQLPVGTNKVRLRARSGFGNDIWLDNICVQSLPTAIANSVGLANEAMFIPTNPYWRLLDTVRVYLHRTDFPNIAVDSAVSLAGSNAIVNNLFFNRALDGTYYRVVKHRNSIETWSSVGVINTRGSSMHYNFIQPDGQAYGNNQAIVSTSPLYRGIFSGDCNQDDFIDIADLAIIDNQVFNFAAGYVIADLNGDLFADLTDYAYGDNNSFNFVGIVDPPGAEPIPPVETESVPELLTEQDRIKYELHQKILREKGNAEETVKVNPELNDVLKEREIRSNIQKSTFRKKDNTRVEKSETGTSEQDRVGER